MTQLYEQGVSTQQRKSLVHFEEKLIGPSPETIRYFPCIRLNPVGSVVETLIRLKP